LKQKILIASTNQNKTDEIRRILNHPEFEFVTLKNYPTFNVAIEDGIDFEENAIIKAKHYYQYVQIPVIADDSGLVVPGLDGEPGIYSARFARENATYAENNKLLLSKMKHMQGKERFAYFVCSAVYFDGQTLIVAEGRAEGEILHEEKGSLGFGYDPLFFYPSEGKTFAQLEPEAKNRISHRSRALQELKKKIK
jgi:XTP/dITP diphosphohydrolase